MVDYGDVMPSTQPFIQIGDDRLRYILRLIAEELPLDAGYIYACRCDTRHIDISILEATGADHYVAHLEDIVRHNHRERRIVDVESGDVGSAILWPVRIHDQLYGGVVLFSHKVYRAEHLDNLRVLVEMVQTVLENYHLTERLITTEAIARTARAIARNPSPQNIVHVLRDYLFDAHVSSCFVGLFGPVRLDQPNGPFDYLEITGSWSRRLGNQIGIGRRFSLAPYQDRMAALRQEQIMTITDIQEFAENRADSFTLMLLEVDNVQSMTLLPLRSEHRNLGLIIITTDEPYEFAPHELRSYQIVGEFLTLSTMASFLQQQSDFVREGRAALLDAVTDAVIMVLPDELSSVLTVNQQFLELFELQEDRVLGTPLAEVLDKMPIPASVRRELHQQWCEPAEQRGEFQMTNVKGLLADIQWYSGPVYNYEQMIGHIYILHDVTSERSSERLRTELLSRISHELRTPLTSIRGFAEFILEADDLSQQAREYTGIIHQHALHLNKLFTDIIEITRANTGELKLYLTESHIEDVIARTVKRLHSHYHERSQLIRLDMEDDLPAIKIDLDRIEQVLVNLVSNAIKYSPQGTEIRITVRAIMQSSDLPESAPPDIIMPCILVSVLDEGEGLTADEIVRIFMPFYRTSSARRRQIDGPGMGLAIAHSIVELHRGKIWAEAAIHKHSGGSFHMTLPLPR
jgi:signal transduction histidine kinase